MCDAKGVDYQFVYSLKQGHIVELARELELQGVDNIVVVGGDGSINETINGIQCLDNINIGIIPAGTGNDLAKSLNISTKPLQAMQTILDNNIVCVDYLYTKTRRAINTISMGIDIDVLTRYNAKRKRTRMSYYSSLLRSLIGYRCREMSFVVDGVHLPKSKYFVVVGANGKYFGGNMKISPNSDAKDGKIHFVVIQKIPFYKVPFALLGFVRGKHIGKKYTQEIVAESIVCQLDDPTNQQIINYDGELINSQFDIKIAHNGCKIYLPLE
jgi:YegS/Rv2252/BmrU family lipid kinase